MSNDESGLIEQVLNAARHVFVLSMVLIFSIGLLVAVTASGMGEEVHAYAEILHEIGHALIVASILGLTVDTYSKKRHELLAEKVTRKINTEVLGAVYGQQFPARIRTEVQRNFLEQRIHREGLEITYSFAELPGTKDRLLVTEQSSFRFVNSSDQPSHLMLKTYLECPLSPELRQHCKILEYSVDGEPFAEDDLNGTFTEDQMELRWNREIIIPAKSSVAITSSCQTVKFSRDVEIWSSLYPSDGITLSVSVDLPLSVFARCNNSEPAKLEINQKHYKRWRVDNGLFPGQSMVFWWNPPESES